jgi:hydroxymethylpyrimidine/phosphomethylpyrimidine kinase
LELDHKLQEAVTLVCRFILGSKAQGANVITGHGHGHGPLNLGFAPVSLDHIPKPPSTANT